MPVTRISVRNDDCINKNAQRSAGSQSSWSCTVVMGMTSALWRSLNASLQPAPINVTYLLYHIARCPSVAKFVRTLSIPTATHESCFPLTIIVLISCNIFEKIRPTWHLSAVTFKFRTVAIFVVAGLRVVENLQTKLHVIWRGEALRWYSQCIRFNIILRYRNVLMHVNGLLFPGLLSFRCRTSSQKEIFRPSCSVLRQQLNLRNFPIFPDNAEVVTLFGLQIRAKPLCPLLSPPVIVNN